MDLSRDVSLNHFYTCPMSGVGLFNDLHLQIKEIRPAKGDIVLMMSDGCYAHLDYAEIKFYLDKRDWTHQQIVSELQQLSNGRGNADNQSTVLLEF
jgi:serine/threonine protein phosphatase PrpC